MPDEIKSLLADETVNDLESECLITFMGIALEYISNLRTNPKNRSKYEAAQQRLEHYVAAARVADFTEEEPEALDDIIGSLFERLLKVAAYYSPIEPIGPMYLCWMLEKRLLKFANPAGEPRNLLLINNVREELFATKIEWHAGRPSTSDEARVYLFDALCAFWEEYFGKSTELSRFLFEKTLPYYSDFMKADTLPSKSAMTHDFVRYHTAVFSNELQQRISPVFSSMLKLKYDALSFALSIDPSCLNEFDGIQTKNETMDFLKNIGMFLINIHALLQLVAFSLQPIFLSHSCHVRLNRFVICVIIKTNSLICKLLSHPLFTQACVWASAATPAA